MQNSVVLPHSVVVGTQIMSSTRPRLGESPTFVASVPAFPGFQAFCSVADEVDPEANPSRLSFGGDADAFALCTNTSANARVDLVYAPRANHAHYSLEECKAVDVKIISLCRRRPSTYRWELRVLCAEHSLLLDVVLRARCAVFSTRERASIQLRCRPPPPPTLLSPC